MIGMLRRVRVVVTGGAGFIGANLVRDLLLDPEVETVSVVDDLSTGFKANLDDIGVDVHEGTILDRELLDRAFDGADTVVHLAGLGSVPRSVDKPLESHHANATGTVEVLEAARRAGSLHVIVASSSSVYGANPTLPKSEDLRADPVSPYAVSKLATEAYTCSWARVYGLPVLPFRFFNVFGPFQFPRHVYASVVPAFLDAALAGRPLPVHGDGRQSRDFTYVKTLTAVIVEAVRRRVTSDQPLNLAFGTRWTLLEMIDHLEEILGRSLDREHAPSRPGDVPHTQADATQLRSLFPDIEPVDFRTALAETVEWFASSAGTAAAAFSDLGWAPPPHDGS